MSLYGFEHPQQEAFPPIVMVDVTNVCNGRCIHCPSGDMSRREGYAPAYLDAGLFEKLMRETSAYRPAVVRITADGEPLLHPGLFDMLESAVKHGVRPLNLTTNGSLLSAEKVRRLLALGVDLVDVSLDAASAQTYERIRPGLDFSRVVANVHGLLERRDPARTRVMVSIIRMKENEAELDGFVRYWEERVDRVLVRALHSNRGAGGRCAPPQPLPARYPCPHLWKRLILDYRGRVRYCPVDWDGASAEGDYRTQSFRDVWTGEAMKRNRALHLEGAFARVGACGPCTDWAATPWDHGYEKAVRTVFGRGAP